MYTRPNAGDRIVVAVSGGMDSATLLAHILHHGGIPIPIGFLYGSKHNQYEAEAADKLCAHYGVQRRVFDLSPVFADFPSSLMKAGGEVPEGHYTDASMSSTVVPARNIIFASIMAGIAWSCQATHIALGVHAGDHAIYEDCRPEFIKALDTMLFLGTGSRVQVWAPFLNFDKGDIAILGNYMHVPYELTRTCYKDQALACGRCGSCVERLEAFDKAGTEDPIAYQFRTRKERQGVLQSTTLVGGPDDPDIPTTGGRV